MVMVRGKLTQDDRAKVIELEGRLEDLEERVTSEVRRRAASSRRESETPVAAVAPPPRQLSREERLAAVRAEWLQKKIGVTNGE